jgi:hypothetical protein
MEALSRHWTRRVSDQRFGISSAEGSQCPDRILVALVEVAGRNAHVAKEIAELASIDSGEPRAEAMSRLSVLEVIPTIERTKTRGHFFFFRLSTMK